MSPAYGLLIILAIAAEALSEKPEKKTKAIIIDIDESAPEKTKAVITDLSEEEQGRAENYVPAPNSQYTDSRIVLDKNVGYVLISPEHAKQLHLDSGSGRSPRYLLIRQNDAEANHDHFKNSTVPHYFYRPHRSSSEETSGERSLPEYRSPMGPPSSSYSSSGEKYPARIGPPAPPPVDVSESQGRNAPPHSSEYSSSEIDRRKPHMPVRSPRPPRPPLSPRSPLYPPSVSGFLSSRLLNGLFPKKPFTRSPFTTPAYGGLRFYGEYAGLGPLPRLRKPFPHFMDLREPPLGGYFPPLGGLSQDFEKSKDGGTGDVILPLSRPKPYINPSYLSGVGSPDGRLRDAYKVRDIKPIGPSGFSETGKGEYGHRNRGLDGSGEKYPASVEPDNFYKPPSEKSPHYEGGPNSYPPPPPPSSAEHDSYRGPGPAGYGSYGEVPPGSSISHSGPPPPSEYSSHSDIPRGPPSSYLGPPPPEPSSYNDHSVPNKYDVPPPPSQSGPSYYGPPPPPEHNSYKDSPPPSTGYNSYNEAPPPPPPSGYHAGNGPSDYSGPDPLYRPKTVSSYSYSTSNGSPPPPPPPQTYSSHSSHPDNSAYSEYSKPYDSSLESPPDYPKTTHSSYGGPSTTYFTEHDALPHSGLPPARKPEPLRKPLSRDPESYNENSPHSSEVPDYHKAKQNYEPVRPPPRSSLHASKLHPPLPPAPKHHSSEEEDSANHKEGNARYGPPVPPPEPESYHPRPEDYSQPHYDPKSYMSSYTTSGYSPGYHYEKKLYPYSTEPSFYRSPSSGSSAEYLDNIPRYYSNRDADSSSEDDYDRRRRPVPKYDIGKPRYEPPRYDYNDNHNNNYNPSYDAEQQQQSYKPDRPAPKKISTGGKVLKLRKRPRLKHLSKLTNPHRAYPTKPPTEEPRRYKQPREKVYEKVPPRAYVPDDDGDKRPGEEEDSNAAIPGEPGRDYPVLNSVPKTDFSCYNKPPGFYADIDNRCQVYYQCTETGKVQSFLCPNGTLFNQETFVCEWWHNVDCSSSERHFARNNDLYKVPEPEPHYAQNEELPPPHYQRERAPSPKLRYRSLSPDSRRTYRQSDPADDQRFHDNEYQPSRREPQYDSVKSTAEYDDRRIRTRGT